MARTAAVVGTATATRNAVNRRQANKNVAAYSEAVNQSYQAPPQQYAPPPQYVEVMPPAAPSPTEDVITQLERLGALRAQGILTEEEFTAQKTRLMGL
jgi:hypothetical protein